MQVARVHFGGEARGSEQRRDVAAELAAAGERGPEGLQAPLPGAHAGVGGAAVFGEQQLPTRLQQGASSARAGGSPRGSLDQHGFSSGIAQAKWNLPT